MGFYELPACNEGTEVLPFNTDQIAKKNVPWNGMEMSHGMEWDGTARIAFRMNG